MSAGARPLVVFLILLLIAPGTLLAGDGEAPTLEALDGAPLTAEDLERETFLLVVWASWSPRCRDVTARIDRLAAAWSDTARVASVVFQEEPAKIRAFLGGKSPGAPIYLDRSGDFSKRHEVTTLPMLLIFAGELAFRGKLSANPDPVIKRVLEQRRR